jgi:hypothetical protein
MTGAHSGSVVQSEYASRNDEIRSAWGYGVEQYSLKHGAIIIEGDIFSPIAFL